MNRNRIAILAAGSLMTAVQLAAQAAGTCSGPAAAIGVVAYQCASCGINLKGGRITYSFNAEPVITQVTATSVLRPGDVVEAVGGKPITTSEGADAFAYPAGLASGQAGTEEIGSVEIVKGPSAAAMYGAGAANGVIAIVTKRGKGGGQSASDSGAARLKAEIVATLDHVRTARGFVVVGDTVVATAPRPLLVIDGVIQDWPSHEIVLRVRRDGKSITVTAPLAERCDDEAKPPLPPAPGFFFGIRREDTPPRSAPTNHLGLAIACDSLCSPAQTRDGTDYYRFGRYPSIFALVEGGPAEAAGLKVGDLLTEVDGVSMLTEEGAVRFAGRDAKESMHVTVMREGRKLAYVVSLKGARKSRD